MELCYIWFPFLFVIFQFVFIVVKRVGYFGYVSDVVFYLGIVLSQQPENAQKLRKQKEITFLFQKNKSIL
jgi:hypothetical protein